MNDAVLLLLGSGLGVLASGIGSIVQAQIGRGAQRRDHEHDETIEQARLAGERQFRGDEAIRAMRRERMAPVFDALKKIEELLVYRSLAVLSESVLSKGAADQALKEAAEKILGDGSTFSDADREEVLADVRKKLFGDANLEQTRHILLFQIMVSASRLGDLTIRRDLLLLLSKIAGPDPVSGDITNQLSELHERIERYAAGVGT